MHSIDGDSVGCLQLLADGGTLQLAAGSIALACLLLDFGWATPAIPNEWDPPGQHTKLRAVVTGVAVLYVFSCIPAAVLYWRFVRTGTMFRSVQLVLGCLLWALVYISNSYSPDYYTAGHWQGAHWSKTQGLLTTSVLLCVIGYAFSFPCEERAFVSMVARAPSRLASSIRTFYSWCSTKKTPRDAPLLEPTEANDILQNDERGEEVDVGTTLLQEESSIIDESLQERDSLEEGSVSTVQTRNSRRYVNESVNGVFNAFCRASHAPFVFGCSAYLLALAVCAFSLVLSFYSFEPNSQCFAWLSEEKSRAKLEMSYASALGKEFPIGDSGLKLGVGMDTVLSVEYIDPANAVQKVTLWQTLPGEAFVRASKGSLESWSAKNVFYFEDSTGTISDIQTIDEIKSEDGHVKILGTVGWPQGGQARFIARLYGSPVTNTGGDQVVEFTLNVTLSQHEGFSAREKSEALRAYLIYAREPEELFFGFGSQLSYVVFERACVPIIVREKGFGRGSQPFTFFMNRFDDQTGANWQHSHTAIPYYMTTYGRSGFIENQGLSVFDLTRKDRVSIEIVRESSGMPTTARFAATISRKNSPKQLLERHTLHSGRMRGLPGWTGAGLIAGVDGGEANVLKQVAHFKENGVPLAGLIVRDWTGKISRSGAPYLNFQPDLTQYPNLTNGRFLQHLKTLLPEVKLLLYFSPYVSTVGRGSVKSNVTTTFEQAKRENCLVISNSGTILIDDDSGTSSPYAYINLGKSQCRKWYADKVIGAQKYIDGWIADHGEGLPLGSLALGDSNVDSAVASLAGSEGHNNYAERWIETNALASLKRDAPSMEQPLVITRTATGGSVAGTSLHSTGNQLCSWDSHDGLASALKGILSSGFSGLSISSSFVGGVNYAHDAFGLIRFIRSPELVKRWIEFSAFAEGALISHRGVSLTETGYHPLQLSDQSVVTHVVEFIKVHTKLWDYKRSLMEEASKTGIPMVRHMMLEFPNDRNTFLLERQFMLGSKYLVCPTLEASSLEVDCYIPALPSNLAWRYFWEDKLDITSTQVSPLLKETEQTTISCKAPLGMPCVFVATKVY
uniref:Alpha-glucosidase n=1 Tax=Mucochytrium quahogii TaxID=96639 RepID=A0A7S2WH36_9STRA|mmetsp:Transcript_4928/g.7466  ORF Transcript_4928/g.7466 Transcript_4928/m.7466 type:complete len:1073 (+) Transcript_4928:151-3369(+)